MNSQYNKVLFYHIHFASWIIRHLHLISARLSPFRYELSLFLTSMSLGIDHELCDNALVKAYTQSLTWPSKTITLRFGGLWVRPCILNGPISSWSKIKYSLHHGVHHVGGLFNQTNMGMEGLVNDWLQDQIIFEITSSTTHLVYEHTSKYSPQNSEL